VVNQTLKKWHIRQIVTLMLLFAVLTLCMPISPHPTKAFNSVASTTGNLIGDFFLIGTDAGQPRYFQQYASIAYNPHRMEYLVVWHNARPVYPDIQAQRVGKDGQLVGGPFYIAGGNNRQRRYPDVVYNTVQREYLVVWEEIPDNGHANIYMQVVGPTGGLVGNAIPLGTDPEIANCYKPAVAYASTADSYMVVWERMVQNALSGDIEAQVIPGSGSFVPNNIVIATGTTNVDHSEPDIAYNRSRNEYLVVWTRFDISSDVKDIWGRIITRNGILLGSELLIGFHTLDEYNASVVGTPTAPNFGGYYVVWEAKYTATDHDIYGRQVGWDGLLPVEYYEISRTTQDETEPALAYSESKKQFYAAWTRVVNASLGMTDIRGRVFKIPAAVVANESVAGAWTYARRPAVAAGPTGDFFTVWDDAPWIPDRDVYGRLWGIRIYVPAVMRKA
jgi:hypothetical protein